MVYFAIDLIKWWGSPPFTWTFSFDFTAILKLNFLKPTFSFGYIIWLSLIRVTDWLNTVTWLKHNSVCSPPQSCGGGTLIDTTKCFHSEKMFTQINGKMSLRYYRFKNVYWPCAGCLLHTQYTIYALHCAQENPRWTVWISMISTSISCRSPAPMGSHII